MNLISWRIEFVKQPAFSSTRSLHKVKNFKLLHGLYTHKKIKEAADFLK
jgi:hypothetical protein